MSVALAACTPKFVTPPTVPPGEARVELQPLPPDAMVEALPEGIPEDDRIEALEEKDKAPFAGVLVGEGVAARYALLRARYPELRVRYEQDRKVWGAHRTLYEERLRLADLAIQDLQPSWWDLNKLSIGFLGGVLGGLAIGLAFAQ